MKQKVIVIVGPTAVGKSALAVRLARRFNGEVISADSCQVYRDLDLGTGKITRREMQGITHHLLDVANPHHQYSVVRYIVQAQKAIADILRRGKVPIICGGTGFYICALVDGITLPDVPPNKKLRARLNKKTLATLLRILQRLDPVRAKEIDIFNKRRVIRAIEIASALGSVPKISDQQHYKPLFIGITLPREELRARIHLRLAKRLGLGMIAEVKRLHQCGLSWKRMEELGLEYRFVSRFLRGLITKKEMIEKLETEIWRYAKRQMTWFRRDKRIRWFTPSATHVIETQSGRFLNYR